MFCIRDNVFFRSLWKESLHISPCNRHHLHRRRCRRTLQFRSSAGRGQMPTLACTRISFVLNQTNDCVTGTQLETTIFFLSPFLATYHFLSLSHSCLLYTLSNSNMTLFSLLRTYYTMILLRGRKEKGTDERKLYDREDLMFYEHARDFSTPNVLCYFEIVYASKVFWGNLSI